jgi:hypothetical protein
MFELNNTLKIKRKQIKNSFVYVIDNFYKYPEKIKYFIEKNPAHAHKIKEEGSLNMKYFEDLRHSYNFKDMENVEKYLQKIINQEIKYKEYNFLTNVIKFTDKNFNDYKNNYWYPHKDFGYTAIIYFDKENLNGTNLYEDISGDFNELKNISEHAKPWRPKKKWKIIHTIKSKYNRCVIFDGNMYHGMAINDNTYFEKHRINQVIFFKNSI